MAEFRENDVVGGVRLIRVFRQKNSWNGVGIFRDEEVFFKIASDSRASLEPAGYRAIAPYFPQPEFRFYKKIGDDLGLVVFERIPELEEYRYLLGGWMRSGINADQVRKSKEWNTICELVSSTHQSTMHIGTPTGPVELHSRDKVMRGGKLDQLYGPNWEGLDFLHEIRDVVVDGRHIRFNWADYKRQLRDFGESTEPTIKSISHGCLSELNLSILPMFFDVTSAGDNPVMADIISFYLSISFTDDYIVPKFLPDLVPRFPEILVGLRDEYGHDWEMRDKSSIEVHFNKPYDAVRRAVLEELYQKVLYPVVEKGLQLKSDWDWRNESVQYGLLRTLALFKLQDLPKSDQALVIAYMARMHDWKEAPDQYPYLPRVGRLV